MMKLVVRDDDEIVVRQRPSWWTFGRVASLLATLASIGVGIVRSALTGQSLADAAEHLVARMHLDVPDFAAHRGTVLRVVSPLDQVSDECVPVSGTTHS